MNLSSISSQLNISLKELRHRASLKGINIPARANKIDNQLASRILEALKVPEKKAAPKPIVAKKVQIPEFIKVRDFAVLLEIPVGEVIKALITNGVMATINEEVDYDTAAIIAQDLGYEVSEAETENTDSQEFGIGFLQGVLKEEADENLKPRPPIIAVMGHVDHGKTTLLDAIRTTDVVSGESGGITQHIGAYSISYKGKPLTFLDTPGHEAFVEMRARGANVTDIIILVVAADDSVRPQTIEVINRAKFTNTPIVVAINKVDKETANVLRVKQELADHGVTTEEWGGTTIAVEVSAKQNQGIDTLLEMVLLQAELENLKANPNGKIAGTVIEAHLAHGKGPVATIIVQNGTLKVGDVIVAGTGYGRIKLLEDENGKKIKSAGPSKAVRVIGLSEIPEAGDIVHGNESIDEARQQAQFAQKKNRSHRLLQRGQIQGDSESKTLNLIIKADVGGSLEALKQSLGKLKNEEVKVDIVSEGVGEVNETDVLLAADTKSTVIAFRAKINPKALTLAQQKKVLIEEYDIIYELLESVTSALIAMFTPEYERHSYGKAKVLGIFRTEKGSMIIGGMVTDGEIRKKSTIAILREGEEIGRGEILELQQSKIAAKEVSRNNEFGMKLKTNVKVKENDMLESFEEALKQKTL